MENLSFGGHTRLCIDRNLRQELKNISLGNKGIKGQYESIVSVKVKQG